MSEFLSQEEVDALLRGVSREALSEPEPSTDLESLKVNLHQVMEELEAYRRVRNDTVGKALLLDWMIANNITIRFDSPMTWTRPDGTRYMSNWYVCGPHTGYSTEDTALGTLRKAYADWREHHHLD